MKVKAQVWTTIHINITNKYEKLVYFLKELKFDLHWKVE